MNFDLLEITKQQGKKLRDIDKQRKQKLKQRESDSTKTVELLPTDNAIKPLPWILLAISWLGFVAYLVFL